MGKNLFDKYPGLEYITWTQYTPYFNDGDPCYFRSSHTYCSINTHEAEEFDRSNFTEDEANQLKVSMIGYESGGKVYPPKVASISQDKD